MAYKWDHMKLKSLLQRRKQLTKYKDSQQNGREIFANDIPVTGLVSKPHKELNREHKQAN